MMAPISWLTVHAASQRLGVSIGEVLKLAAGGRLVMRTAHEHYVVSEESVDAYLSASELAASGDVLAEYAHIPVRQGPELPTDIEDEYQRGKNT